MNYSHLTQEERYQILALLHEDLSRRHIASRLARASSTILREIKRNHNRNGYFTRHAHQLAQEHKASNHVILDATVWEQVEL